MPLFKGQGTYGDFEVIVFQDITIRIGKYCSIGKGVKIVTGGEHCTDSITTYPFPELDPRFYDLGPSCKTKGDVLIGNDVWIGYGVIILSGVTIGDGACIGAGAVVASDVPPYAVVIGNPARVLRYRFSPDKIQALLEAKWWDWPDAELEAKMKWLLSR